MPNARETDSLVVPQVKSDAPFDWRQEILALRDVLDEMREIMRGANSQNGRRRK